MRNWIRGAVLAMALVCSATPALATPPLAAGYGEGFVEYWKKTFQKQDSIVMYTVGFGAVLILVLLSSGKWGKK